MKQMYTSGLQNSALKESGNGRDITGMQRGGGGGEINACFPQLTELQVRIDCDREHKQGKTARS